MQAVFLLGLAFSAELVHAGSKLTCSLERSFAAYV